VIAQVTWDIGANPKQAAFVWRNGKRTRLRYGNSRWIDVTAINDRGDVVGDATRGDSTVSLLWRNGKPTVLGTLGGSSSSPVAINDRGQVVGTSRTPTAARHAFLWQHGKMTDLGTLGGDDAFPTAINEKGQIIGESTTADGAEHAFLWQNGAMTDLGSLNGNNSVARAINDAGVVVGDIDTPAGEGYPVEAVAWKNGTMTELGTFGARGARALAVNAHGDVLVELDDKSGDSVGGVLLRSGRVTKIPALGGSPPPNQGGPLVLTGLNDRDEVAGYGYTRRGAGRRIFIWRPGRMTLLPTRDGVQPPWGAPVQLNDAGALAGTTYVELPNGHSQQRGSIWRPAEP
jgi:probable HAF family extracellular repeat protein